MTKKEHEFKMMLDRDEYQFFLCFFDKLLVESGLQTNYYYDTQGGAMRKRNVTVRVRKKNNRLLGTVKRHANADNCSIEERFHLDALPRVIVWDNVFLWLKGSLQTKRKRFRVCDGITVMLDLNQYLDTVDYELEIEYLETLQERAEGVVMLIRSLLRHNKIKDGTSKSERFFQCLDRREGVFE